VFRLNSDIEADPLGDILSDVRFRSTIFCRSEMRAPWGFSVQGREVATFHFVECGACRLEVPEAAVKLQLDHGDFVILPHGHAHVVRDGPGSEVTRLDNLVSDYFDAASGTLRFGGNGEPTSLICGGFFFEDREALPFLAALPPVPHISGRGNRIGDWLKIAQELMSSDVASGRVGENTMLTRISDLIFIEAVRSHFIDAEGAARGWFAALTDRHVGRAISLNAPGSQSYLDGKIPCCGRRHVPHGIRTALQPTSWRSTNKISGVAPNCTRECAPRSQRPLHCESRRRSWVRVRGRLQQSFQTARRTYAR